MKNFIRNNTTRNKSHVFTILMSSLVYLLMYFPIHADAHSIGELSEIKDFAYSPDGNRFAVAAYDEIWLFDAHTYEKRFTIEDDTHAYGGWSNKVEFSPDGSILASVNNRTDEIQLWNPNYGVEQILIFEETESISSILFSPDGKTIASEGSDDIIRFWDVETGHLLNQINVDSNGSFVFSPDGNTIATSGIQRIMLWDINTGDLKHTLEGHTDEVYAVAFSPDGEILASSGFQKIILWDPHTGKRLNTLTGHRGCVESLAFSPDGSIIAGGSYQEILLWDLSKAQHIKTLSKPNIFLAGVTSLEFSPDGRKIASFSGDEWGFGNSDRIQIWDVKSGKHQLTVWDNWSHNNPPIKFSPDVNTATYIIEDSFSGWQYVIVFLQLPLSEIESGITNIGKVPRKGKILSEVHETPVHYRSPVKSTLFSKDGKTLVSVGNGDIALWNTDSGEHRITIKDEFAQIYSVALSPDGKTLASGNGWNNNQIRLWNAKNGNLKAILDGHTSWIDDLAFSTDGKTLFSASRDSTIRLWDVNTGKHKQTLNEHTAGVHILEFSSDGEMLASACQDNTIMLWEMSSTLLNGKPIATYDGHTDKIHLIRFSSNGKTLASASWDNTIRLCDTETGKHNSNLSGHTSWIDYLEFSIDGKTLISGSMDKTIRLWDTNTGTLRSTLAKNRDEYSQIVMSPDGKTLVSKVNYHSLDLWDLNSGKLQATIEGAQIAAYEFLPSGNSLITTDARTRWLHKWSVETGKLLMKIKTQPD